jgi:hypothetical protein
MSVRELTQQQLDPAAGYELRRPILLMLAILPVLLVTLAVVRFLNSSSPVTALVAIALVATACVVLVVVTSPSRAPVSRLSHMLVLALALAALLVDVAAGWSTDPNGRNNLIPIAIGVFTLVLAPFRPPRELAVGGILTAILVGAVAQLHAHVTPSTVLPGVHVVTWAGPVLALSLAAAVFGFSMLRELDRWRRKAATLRLHTSPVLRQEMSRAVQRDRVSVLDREVVPLFSRVLERGEVTEEDQRQARAIAESIRTIMVADVDRSWLESGLARHLPGGVGDQSPVVDPNHIAPTMGLDGRAAMRALLLELFRSPGFEPASLRIVFSEERGQVRVALDARVHLADRASRASLDPYLAVLRVLFPGMTLKIIPSSIRLEFMYGRS